MREEPRSARRWCSVWRRTGQVVLIVVVLGYLVILELVVHPRVDAPGRSDVVVVLGPSWPARVADATRLVREGRARALVVSAHPADTEGTPPEVCRVRQPFPVYCFDPVPSTTQGEARAVARLASEHHWESAQVVTFAPQVERARLIIGRCYSGRVSYLASDESYDAAYQWLYHSTAFVKALVRPGC